MANSCLQGIEGSTGRIGPTEVSEYENGDTLCESAAALFFIINC